MILQYDIITHNSSVKNIGSSTGTNMQVVLTYNTGTVSYISGSLDFGSGTLVDTGSIVIDENAGTISFTITSIAPNFLEEITFKTKATGAIGTKIKTEITTSIDEGFNSNTTSNEFTIVAVPVVSHGGGGGGYSSDKKIYNTKKKEEILNKKKEDEEKNEREEFNKNIDNLKSEYENFLKKQRLLEELLKEDKIEQSTFVLPKILPKTGTAIEERTYRRNVNRC